jgi:hypothetical protein
MDLGPSPRKTGVAFPAGSICLQAAWWLPLSEFGMIKQGMTSGMEAPPNNEELSTLILFCLISFEVEIQLK